MLLSSCEPFQNTSWSTADVCASHSSQGLMLFQACFMGSIPFKIIINLNRVSTNLCKSHSGCCLGIDYKAHLAIVCMLVNFKVLGEISESGEHQRVLRGAMKCGTQIFLCLPPRGVPVSIW